MSASVSPLRPFGRKEPPSPLPDAKSSYEWPLKRELANRLYAICLAYFSVIWFALYMTTLNLSKGPPMGHFGNLLATTLFAGVTLLFGGLPPLFLRGRSISGKISLFLHTYLNINGRFQRSTSLCPREARCL